MLTNGKRTYKISISSEDRYETLKKIYLIMSTLSGGIMRDKETKLLAAIASAVKEEGVSFWRQVEKRVGITPGNRRVICSGLKGKGLLTGKEIVKTLHIPFDDRGNFNISLEFSERLENKESSEEYGNSPDNGEES